MPIITESDSIPGVYVVQLDTFQDDRGRFSEIFRKDWFPQRDWQVIQSNRSESERGVLRGLHYHHNQVDYWHVAHGTIRAGLVDLRSSSPGRGQSQIIDIHHNDGLGLFIPVGVAHGFLSVSPSTLIYIVDSYYDGSDEYGVAWDDPEINLNWGDSSPKISDRDKNNPRFIEIPPTDLPA